MNKHIKEALHLGGWAAIIFFFCKNKSFVVTGLWVLAWSWLVELVAPLFSYKRKKEKDEPKPNPDPRFDTPRKAVTLFLNLGISNLLFYLNPLLVIQTLLQLTGMVWEKIFGHPVLDAQQYRQKVNYILPVTGEWHVFNGGITKETS